MANLTVVQGTSAGVAVSLVAAAAGGDEFTNTDNEVLIVANGHASATRDVTIVTQKTVDGLAVADQVKTVPAQSRVYFSNLARDVYNDASGKVQITYSDAGADLTVGVLKTK